MSVNSSGSSLRPVTFHCLDSSAVLAMSFTIIRTVLLLPLCVLVLYLSLQRWRRPSRSSSHGDIFTFHLVSIELIGLVGSMTYICGTIMTLPLVAEVGIYVGNIAIPSQMSFHVLTSVERYLAVVHPVTYRRMKQSEGVRIRNICIAFVWLLSCSWIGVMFLFSPVLPIIPILFFLLFSLAVVSFCRLCVLCLLTRPRPGDVSSVEHVSRSKRRALATIMMILAVLWVWFCASLLSLALDESSVLTCEDGCLAIVSSMWFSLPSSLVLPLLFLYRAGKSLCDVCSSAE